jgi:nitroimidazol reductase NimA-like FMN-containing flavoprotein (pyridoxamine 5'-phosphate oxidase superfamily)
VVAGILLAMDVNGPVLAQLSRDECLRLMGSVPVGRIVYTRQALPAVELVSFALDGGDIVIAAVAGGRLAAATRGAVVAFEADSVDVAGRAGWSVTVVGHATAVTDDEEIGRLEQLPLTPWAPGKRDHFVRISSSIVNGRRIEAGQLARGSDARHT